MSNPLTAATDLNNDSLITSPCSLTYEMADNSDTESDSGNSVLAHTGDIPSQPAFNANPESLKLGISQIIQTLLHQPLTPFRHEDMEAASSTLIHFVDDISSRLKHDADVLGVMTGFALLGT